MIWVTLFESVSYLNHLTLIFGKSFFNKKKKAAANSFGENTALNSHNY